MPPAAVAFDYYPPVPLTVEEDPFDGDVGGIEVEEESGITRIRMLPLQILEVEPSRYDLVSKRSATADRYAYLGGSPHASLSLAVNHAAGCRVSMTK